MFDFGTNLFEMVMFHAIGKMQIYRSSDRVREDRSRGERRSCGLLEYQNRIEPVQSLRSISSARVSAKDSATGFNSSCRSVRRGLT